MVGTLLGVVGFVGVLVGLFALVRGRLGWARVRTRKQAGMLLTAAVVVLITGALVSAPPTTTTLASTAVTTSPVDPPTSEPATPTASPPPATPTSAGHPVRSASARPTPSSVATPSPTVARPEPTTASPKPAKPPPHRSPPRTSSPAPTKAQPTTPAASPREGAHGAVLPDRHRTPGAVFPSATRAAVCTVGYSARMRHVTDTTRRAVFTQYGIPWAKRHSYEVDHLIPLELGGSNRVANLWPEPEGSTRKGYPRKDQLENHLHALVCTGKVNLRTAQHAIATNWATAYNHYQPMPAHSSQSTAPPPKAKRHRTATTVPTGGGATAKCNDGTYSHAAHHQGACSRHHGVRVFYK